MKQNFTVSVDTCCDEFKKVLDAQGIPHISLTFLKDGVERRDDYETDEEYQAFYKSIRSGALPTTSLINQFDFEKFFTKTLSEREGDLLHVSLSSGLSGTYANAIKAAEVVQKSFPKRRIEIVDSLGGTRLLYMLTQLALKDMADGLDLLECANHLREVVAHSHIVVVADDLVHFKRGGRVTGAAAFFGTMLSIKPIIHVNPKGELRVIDKTLGIKKGLKYCLNYLAKYGKDIEKQTLYIAHADCVDRAAELKSMILEHYPSADINIGWIGPIIGTHTGSGTCVLIFTGQKRWDKK